MKGRTVVPLLAIVAGLAGVPPAALAASGNAVATQATCRPTTRWCASRDPTSRPPKRLRCSVLATVERECPLAAAGSPQNPESTQMSDEVIGAMVIGAAQPDLQAIRAYIRAVAGLTGATTL